MPFLLMVISRLLQAAGVMLVVALLAFVLSNYVGDPISNLVGQETSLEDRERLRETLGLNDPAPVQFARFVTNALQGDFGISYRFQRPVSVLIAERAPATLELVAVSALFATLIGIVLGIFTAINRENVAAQILKSNLPQIRALRRLSWGIQLGFLGILAGAIAWPFTGSFLYLLVGAVIFGGSSTAAEMQVKASGIQTGPLAFTAGTVGAVVSQLIMATSLIGVSLPTFVIGILFIYAFAVTLQILPSSGRGEVINVGGWRTQLLTTEGWKAIIMPAVTLGLYQLTILLRLVRSEMLEVLRTDYIKFAKARGLRTRDVHYGHALKNTMLPVITITGLQVGGLVAFSIITETVFNTGGISQLFVQAVQFADVPIMSAYLVLASLIFVTVNFIVDILYFAIDPRLRTQLARSGGKSG